MIIDLTKLRNMDYVFTTNKSIISNIIRYKSSGKAFNQKVSTHVGLLCELYGKWFVFEMLYKEGLSLNPLKKYLSGKSHIVAIKRNTLYDVKAVRENAIERCMNDYYEGIDYDVKGIIEYMLPNLIDKPKEFYCSEYVNHNAILDGRPLFSNNDDDCKPYDIQTKFDLLPIKWKVSVK